ncbi:AAA family ATPase [Pseudoxanthomonas mexicana]
MLVEAITIKKFKAIDQLRLDLKRINVLAGGNNAGKSCALQAIHVAVALAQTAKAEGAANFAPEKLRYAPTDLFIDLKHREKLSEGGAPVSVEFAVDDGGTKKAYNVTLRRGRNSTISTVSPRELATGLGAALASSDRPFSVYVPGLAGIPSRETYQGRLVVDRGAVRGDANLYLRNVLYRLFRDPVKKAKFEERLAKLFPGLEIIASAFDENRHEHIPIDYVRGGVQRPLDMVGTGTLQAIQILGYVSFYQPALLLLDEPDAHLHPDNQLKLVQALDLLSKEENLQILLATHSRHLIQAVREADEVASFHLKAGALVGTDPDLSELLVDLGAVDKYDVLSLRDKDWLVLGEDKNAESDLNHPLRVMINRVGMSQSRTLVMSFKGCTEIRSIALLAMFCATHHPGVKILVHRDADFLTPSEVQNFVVNPLSTLSNVAVYVTDGSDLEAEYVRAEHISEVCGLTLTQAEEVLGAVALANHNQIVTRFNDKRQAVHKQFGSRGGVASTESLRAASIPLPPDQRVGKDMLGWVENELRARGHLAASATLVTASAALQAPSLSSAIT